MWAERRSGCLQDDRRGETWEKVLYASENTGAIEIKMGPENPRVLYGAMGKNGLST